jgi:hypothetical protein
MTIRRRLGAILSGSMLAATLGVGSVAASGPGTFNFYDCNTGPDFHRHEDRDRIREPGVRGISLPHRRDE